MMTAGTIQADDGLVDRLVARQGTLTKRHDQVARFCLNHPGDVAINPIVCLTAQAQVPPATNTRFTRELGFAGFAGLQRLLRERLLGPRPTYAAQMTDLRARPELTKIEVIDLEHPCPGL